MRSRLSGKSMAEREPATGNGALAWGKVDKGESENEALAGTDLISGLVGFHR